MYRFRTFCFSCHAHVSSFSAHCRRESHDKSATLPSNLVATLPLSSSVSLAGQMYPHARCHAIAHRPVYSRRRMRALARMYGASWRYTPKAEGSIPPTGVLARYEERLTEEQRPHEVGTSVGLVNEVHDSQGCSTEVGSSSSGASSSDICDKMLEDPLLAFLERNKEDGAVLLAMWVSLRRSCLYASEVSEGLAVRVRYFIHYLIRRRAVSAALSLYERYVHLGVQLHSSDLLLLLRNLPYEHSATSAKADDVADWVEQDAKKRRSAARRRRAEGERRAAEAASAASRTGVSETTSASRHSSDASCRPSVVESQSPEVGISNAEVSRTCTSEELQVHSLANKPEWVKRWILYEASMGTIDVMNDLDIISNGGRTLTHPEAIEEDHVIESHNSSCAHGKPEGDLEIAESIHQASRLMEITAIVEHLNLLQSTSSLHCLQESEPRASMGRMPFHKEGSNKGPSISVRSTARVSPEPTYWKEALHFAVRSLQELSLGKDVPTSLLQTLRMTVRMSHSWRAALLWMRRLHIESPAYCSSDDAIFFFRVAANSTPWASSRNVEAFVCDALLPLVQPDTSAAYCIQSLWLAHLCRVKTTRMDDYLALCHRMQQCSTVRWHLEDGTDTLIDVSRLAVARMKLATSHFIVEAKRYGQEQRARVALAASIRQGLFATEREEAQIGGALPPRDTDSAAVSPAPSGTLLPLRLVDTMLICCSAVTSVVSLAIATGMAREQHAGVELNTLLERIVFGPYSLWAMFSQVYLSNEFAAEQVVKLAPERTLIAASVSHTLLHVARDVCQCSQSSSSSAMGRKWSSALGLSPVHIQLLLELALASLAEIPVNLPLGDEAGAVFEQVVMQLGQLTKPFLAFLGLTSKSERVVFGSVPGHTVVCLALIAKLFIRASLLEKQLPRPRARTCNFFYAHHVPWSALGTLRMCYRSRSSLSRQVRSGLTSRECAQLDALFLKRRSHSENSSVVKSHTTADVARFAAAVLLRQELYEILLTHGSAGDINEREMALRAVAQRYSGIDCLRVFDVLYKAVRPYRGSVGLGFFADVIDGMSRALEHSPKGTCISGGVSSAERRSVPGRAADDLRRSSGSGIYTVPSWTDALQVFWAAVDHTGTRSETQSVSCVTVGATPASEAHQRKVLSQMLLPLLRFSMGVQRVDLGRRWHREWVNKFTLADRQQAAWAMKNVEALAALHDSIALKQCVRLVKSVVASEKPQVVSECQSLLCRIAAVNGGWRNAFHALTHTFGSAETHIGERKPYPAPVAQSMLSVMLRAPTNLSNTALRLQALQGASFDIPSTLLLVELLLRGRRWKIALAQVKDLLAKPEVQAVARRVQEDQNVPRAWSADEEEYAAVLVAGLRACAIGGQSKDAALLYDSFKVVLHVIQPSITVVGNKGADRAGSCVVSHRNSVSGLDAALDMTNADENVSLDCVGVHANKEIRDLASQAQSYFFRAMTKTVLHSLRG